MVQCMCADERTQTACREGRESAFVYEAEAAWQWHNHLESKVEVGRRLLRINLDETALCLCQDDQKGNVFLHKGHNAMQKASLAARRAYITHVALVCDDATVQQSLPQIVICNERTLPQKVHGALQASLGDNFVLLRCASAWVNTDVMVEIVRLLAEALEPHITTLQPLLMLDAYRAHIGIRIFHAGARHNIWVLVVPAGLTWLLQVLDTHVFRAYKSCLRNAYQLLCVQNGLETHSLALLLDAVREATAVVINTEEWSDAFTKNGFGQSQSQVRPRVLKALEMKVSAAVPLDRPTESQLRLCFPRKAKLFYKAIWPGVDHIASPIPKVISVRSKVAAKGAAISSRTRSKTK